MRFGIYDLIAPHLLSGVLPEQLENLLDIISIEELQTAWNDDGIVYSGFAQFAGDGSPDTQPNFRVPGGPELDFFDENLNFRFRLTIPRRKSSFIEEGVNAAAGVASAGSPVTDVKDTLDRLEVPGATTGPSDYPGSAFQLELLLNTFTIRLNKEKWKPAKISADGFPEVDPAYEQATITFPKVSFCLEQGDTIGDFSNNFFKGWGNYGLDDPAIAKAGELIRLEPALILDKSESTAIGFKTVVFDFNEDATPPELLSQFGLGDNFRGLWIPLLRLHFIMAKNYDWVFHIGAEDLLLDMGRDEVSGAFDAALISRNGKLKVDLIFFEGETPVDSYRKGEEKEESNQTRVEGSQLTLNNDGELQLAIRGGSPPYAIEVELNGTEINAQAYEGDANRKFWPLGSITDGTHNLVVQVQDKDFSETETDKGARYVEEVNLQRGASTPAAGGIPSSVRFNDLSGTPNYRISKARTQPNPNTVELVANPASGVSIEVGSGSIPIEPDGSFSVPVSPGTDSVLVKAVWSGGGTPNTESISFQFDDPEPNQDENSTYRADQLANNETRIKRFLENAAGLPIVITGYASYDSTTDNPSRREREYNLDLSTRRANILQYILQEVAGANGIPINLSSPIYNGLEEALADFQTNQNRYLPSTYWRADATYTAPPFRKVSVGRTESEAPPPVPIERSPAPDAPQKPPLFKRIEAKVRLERNDFVFGELSGELDFRLQAEESAQLIQESDSTNEGETNLGDQIESDQGASQTDTQGIVDYRLTLLFDKATGNKTITLAVGFDREARDGWLKLNTFNPKPLANTIGSLLTFAPLLAGGIESAVKAEDGDTTAEISLAAAQVGLATLIGLTGALELDRIIFYGAEVSAQLPPPGSNRTANDLSFLLDYAVDFFVNIDLGFIAIKSKKDDDGNPVSLRARYRALGFRLNFEDGAQYIPVFDTSKGFEFRLADPGLLEIDGVPVLSDILKILAVRIARINPMLLEFDLGINANLGIISVDSIRITQVIEKPLKPPSILPTGISVDIPGTLSGSGEMSIQEDDAGDIDFSGKLDITLVPTKLRVAAVVKLKQATDGTRKATAVFVGMEVEFPSAIPLGGSGLGFYGILGLFAMHFKRNENSAVRLPALDWFNTKAEGNPAVPDKPGAWVAELDRWSFGLGVVLGTMGGGSILNLKGMFVLELPGPRILIFVKLQFLQERPETEGRVDNLGILAVVDLNFEIGQFSISAIVEYEIEDVLSLKIPIDAGFSSRDSDDWNVYLGSIDTPVSAKVLGLVKAQAYFMVDGMGISNFPAPTAGTYLPGVALALGVRAAIILGDTDINLYLEVSARMDAGVSFSPFKMYGLFELRGKLHLFILSLSAWASLRGEAPDPTYIEGEACGKISFFFFSISGCVKIKIGSRPPVAPPPLLVRGLDLVSRSSALLQGQGSDRPIDGKLGVAIELTTAGSPLNTDAITVNNPRSISKTEYNGFFSTDEVPLEVPLDVIPVLKLEGPPITSGLTTFTAPISDQSILPQVDGWIKQGPNRKFRYKLLKLELHEEIYADTGVAGKPPASWWPREHPSQGQDHAIDLALFSWVPDPTPRAVQRSLELTEKIKGRWGIACQEAAPPACVLWTFCQQLLGYSPAGWHLKGIQWPDPPDTRRTSGPNLDIHIHEYRPETYTSQVESYQNMSGVTGQLEPAKIKGAPIGDPVKGRVLQLPFEHPANPTNIPIPDGIDQFFIKERERIIVRSGNIEEILLWIVIPRALFSPDQVLLRSYDQGDAILEEVPMTALIEKEIFELDDLPDKWKDKTGPWHPEMVKIFDYLKFLNNKDGIQSFLLRWKPTEKIQYFDIRMLRDLSKPIVAPHLLLAALEMCEREETRRYQFDVDAQQDIQETIQTALRGDQLKPLLLPARRYTIEVEYDWKVEETDNDGNVQSEDDTVTQYFTFCTDDLAPKRLNPWVLLTAPQNDFGYHFVDDPVQIFFNDLSIIQLFKAYDKTLHAVLRKANGNNPDEQPELNMENLSPVQAVLLTPFLETLQIEAAGLDCILTPPSVSHRVYQLPIPLQRGTDYILSIETEGTPAPGTPGDQPRRPLFQFSFATSRFLSLEEMVGLIVASRIKHRLLSNPIPSIPAEASDLSIQKALIDAGLEALPPAINPGLTYLWQPTSGKFKLVAILLDAPEPIWQQRPAPVRKIIEDSGYGEMEHWVMGKQLYQRIEEVGESVVKQFTHSSSGTRTLIFLKNKAKEIHLKIVQDDVDLGEGPASTKSVSLLNTELPEQAPWDRADA